MEDNMIAYALKLKPNPRFPTNGNPTGRSLLTLSLKNFKQVCRTFFEWTTKIPGFLAIKKTEIFYKKNERTGQH
jgi:hypothetical protein